MKSETYRKPVVMTVVGTRPEIIKLSRVIPALDDSVKHILVHTGQNHAFELSEIFFNDMGIRAPDHYLNVVGDNVYETIGKIISKTAEVIQKEKPDAILYYGDTNSSLGVIAAKRLHVPIFHMEAGNRCFDQRVPEENNRKVIDHLSDLNMTISEHARRYLINEGLPPDRIIKVGSCMYEVLNYYMPLIEKSKVMDKFNLDANKYFLVSAHREENVDSPTNINQLLLSLNQLAIHYNYPIVVSVHPRTEKRLQQCDLGKIHKNIRFAKPLGFLDYVKLQKNAFCVISDSGTITEEASILNFPAITIRNAHERPEGMDEGVVIMTGLHHQRVMDGVSIVTSPNMQKERITKLVGDYCSPGVSHKVVRIILSYIDYIKRVVWFENNTIQEYEKCLL